MMGTMRRFCRQCGANLAAESRFCTACGAPIDGTSAAAAATADHATAAPAAPPFGWRRAVLVGSLVTFGLILVAAVIALGPQAPKQTPRAPETAQMPAPPAASPIPAPPAVSPMPALPALPDVTAPPPSGGPAIVARRWERYTNARYGVTIDYPADLFAIQPPPPDNAGRNFEAPEAKARFHIYSHANALGLSIDELQAADVLDLGDAAAVRHKGKDWYSVAGRRNGDANGEAIVRRVLLSEGGTMLHRLEIAYPPASAKVFEPVVARMIQSLKVDPGIPDKAAAAAAKPVPPAQRPVAPVPPAGASGLQTIDTLRLGLAARDSTWTGGLAFQIPADWKRVPLAETHRLRFDGPSSVRDAGLLLFVTARQMPADVPLTRNTDAVKSVIKARVLNYRESNEADTTVALHPARRLTVAFTLKDKPEAQHREFMFIRAGQTVFDIEVRGPEADAAAIRTVLDRVIGTLAVTE